MTSAHAIILGACLIAGSILFVNTLHPAAAQHEGPYQLMHHSNPTANAGVFRLDTSTGEVSLCYAVGSGDKVVCSQAAH